MPITKEERERFEAQARDLAKIKTGDEATPEQRRRIIEFVASLRTRGDAAPLPLENEGRGKKEEDIPELGFYRRAEALGMARIRRD